MLIVIRRTDRIHQAWDCR